jgi:ribonuclease Z
MNGPGNVSFSETFFRLLTGLIGLLFCLLGIGFMTFPDSFAAGFSIQPITVQGLTSLRGDLGGLFLGMGFFSLLGAGTKRWVWFVVPLLFLLLIIIGRLISFSQEGPSVLGVRAVLFEGGLWVLLILSAWVLARRTAAFAPSILKSSDIFQTKILILALIVAAITGGLILSQKRVGQRLTPRIAQKVMAADPLADLPDGLHVALCGSGSPLPDLRRASACTAVIAGKDLYLVDTGPGSERKLELMRLNPGKVKAVFLTHFHSDHIGDLGELMLKRWSGGARKIPVDVYGPDGVEIVVQGFNKAYSLDKAYRIQHHGPETVPPGGAGGAARTFSFPSGKEEAVVLNEAGLKVTAFRVDHRPVEPAVGYRFDYKGRSVVISGDTRPVPSLTQQARKADLLVIEALQPKMVAMLKEAANTVGRANTAKILGDIPSYHTSPEDAAKIAAQAGVGHLLFTHILPPLPVSDLKAAFLGDVGKLYHGPITIGEDGMLFGLPAGTQKIQRKWLL